MKKLSIASLGLTLTLLISSCVPYTPTSTSSARSNAGYLTGFDTPDPVGPAITHNGIASPQGYWDGDGVTGSPSIRINLNDQRAYFYKGKTLVGVSPISTGTDGHGTPKGRFKVTQKVADHKSSLYGIIKDNASGLTINNDADTRIDKPGPGETFEAAPMPYFMRFNRTIGMHAGFLPGYPASHGCVRMPDAMAKKFFENTPLRSTVIVE
ncbi:L,D-transpeptidase family protein [Rubritalea marina]|uniref:L,D-transpeptidase family protein n=1 Tax=Rubritalea marina TaxID=361055 RepID=UPI00036476DC|nr:L,D-transpeptidase family protein [Rubritalea marina]